MQYIIKELISKAEELGFNLEERFIQYEIGNRTPSIWIYGENITGNGIEEVQTTFKVGAGRFSYLGGGMMGSVSTSDALFGGTRKQQEAFDKLLILFKNTFLQMEEEYLNEFDDDDDILDSDGMVRL